MHKIIFVTGPQGCGKTLHSKAISVYLNSTRLLDEGLLGLPETLHLINSALESDIPHTIVVLTDQSEEKLRAKYAPGYKDATVEVRQFHFVLRDIFRKSYPELLAPWAEVDSLLSVLDALRTERKTQPSIHNLPQTIKIDLGAVDIAKLTGSIRAAVQKNTPVLRQHMEEAPARQTAKVELTEEEILRLKDLLSGEKLSPAARSAKGEAMAREAYNKACNLVGRLEADAVVRSRGFAHIDDVKGKVGFSVHQALTRLIKFCVGGTARYTKE